MVADEVDDGDGLLALGGAQAATELLQEDHARLGRPEHHHAIDARHVHAFVQHVDGAEHVQLPALERLQRRLAIVRSLAAEDRVHAQPPLAQPRTHEVGVRDAATEYQRARGRMIAPRAPQRLHARLRLRRARQRLRIEAAIAPWDVRVVDVVLDAEVVERHQPPQLHAAGDVGAIRDEVVEQPEDVRGVRAIRRGRQPQEKTRFQAIEDLPVRRGSRVVNLVHDHVVERLLAELRPLRRARELLHRREHQIRAEIAVVAHAPADARRFAQLGELLPVRLRGLEQQLAPVREEQQPRPRAHLRPERRVVRHREQRLAEPRREHDQRARATLLARFAKLRQRLDLHVVERRQRVERLGLDFVPAAARAEFDRARSAYAAIHAASSARAPAHSASNASHTRRYASASRSRSTRRFHSMPVSSADSDRLLLPTNATPKRAASKRHDFGWNARVRPGSFAVSITRVSKRPAGASSSSSAAASCQSSSISQRARLGDVQVVPREDAHAARRWPSARCTAARDPHQPRLLHERRHDRDLPRPIEQRQHMPRERVRPRRQSRAACARRAGSSPCSESHAAPPRADRPCRRESAESHARASA